MDKRTLLAAATAAGNSLSFSVEGIRGVTVMASGLATTETGTLQITADGGVTWFNATDSAGAIQLTASQSTFLVVGPGDYRIVKSVTAAAVAITVAG